MTNITPRGGEQKTDRWSDLQKVIFPYKFHRFHGSQNKVVPWPLRTMAFSTWNHQLIPCPGHPRPFRAGGRLQRNPSGRPRPKSICPFPMENFHFLMDNHHSWWENHIFSAFDDDWQIGSIPLGLKLPAMFFFRICSLARQANSTPCHLQSPHVCWLKTIALIFPVKIVVNFKFMRYVHRHLVWLVKHHFGCWITAVQHHCLLVKHHFGLVNPKYLLVKPAICWLSTIFVDSRTCVAC